MPSQHYLWKKLRMARAPLSGVDVVGFKRMQTGVLRGQIMRCFLSNHPNVEEAIKAHPEVTNYSTMDARWDGGEPVTHVNHLPGPDDQEPGGAWPDDR